MTHSAPESSLVFRALATTALVGVVVVGLLHSEVAAQDVSERVPFTIDHAIDLVSVSGAQLSPDGTRVLFIRQELDWAENKRESRIWIAAPGQTARAFTGQVGDSRPQWSPDGQWVSFVRSVGEPTKTGQLFLLPTSGGEAMQLTQHPTSVGAYAWSGDSNALFFLADDSLSTDAKSERKKGDDAIFVDEGPNGQTRSEWNGVWAVRADFPEEPLEAARWTQPGLRVGTFAVAPEGRRLAYTFRSQGRRNDGNLSEIALVEGALGEPAMLTSNQAPESSLAWSPDGEHLAFVAPDLETWELDQGNLYVTHVRTGDHRALRRIRRSVARSALAGRQHDRRTRAGAHYHAPLPV